MIQIQTTSIITDPITRESTSKTVQIIITNAGQSYTWYVGGLPLTGDLQPILDARFDELWRAASERAIPVPTSEIFQVPIIAPDFIVQTPKINDDPEKALDEAVAEMKKGEGTEKSLALMTLSLVKYLEAKRAKLK